MAKDERKFSWHIGKHPEVIALETRLREVWERDFPRPTPGLDLEEHMRIYEPKSKEFNRIQVLWRDLANEIASQFDRRGFPVKAFCSEQFLQEVVTDGYDPYGSSIELLFGQNYRFGYNTEFDNIYQNLFIKIDDWMGRIGNSGAGTMFLDPEPQCLDVWITLNLLNWPEFERKWRTVITKVLRTSATEIERLLEHHEPRAACEILVDSRFGTGTYERAIEWDDFDENEKEAIEEIENFTSDMDELESKILAAIWAHRAHLIQSHPDGMDDPEEWRIA